MTTGLSFFYVGNKLSLAVQFTPESSGIPISEYLMNHVVGQRPLDGLRRRATQLPLVPVRLSPRPLTNLCSVVTDQRGCSSSCM